MDDKTLNITVARQILEEVKALLYGLELNTTQAKMPEGFNDPYSLITTMVAMVKYKDMVYSSYIQKGFSPDMAIKKTEEHLMKFSDDLKQTIPPMSMSEVNSNVIQFKPKDNK